MIARRTGIVLALALLGVGCAVGPRYARPEVTVPAFFKEEPAAGSTLAVQWQRADPGDDVLRTNWWEIFQDPQLSALAEQVEVSNQTVAQAEARFQAARAAIRGARANLFPTVTAGASVDRSRSSSRRIVTSDSAGGAAGGTTVTDHQLPIDFSYEADLWGRVRRGVEASVATAVAAGADVETALLSMRAELVSDYFELRGLDARIAFLDKTVAAYERALRLTTARYDQGIASGVDVAQAQTQLDTARAQATDLQVARAQFEHAIASLVGKAPADLSIAPAATEAEPPVIPVTLPSRLVERRPDVAAAERRVAAANAQIGVTQAAFFPHLLLTAGGGLESSTLSKLLSWPSRFWSIGPSLVETVFDGGSRRSLKEQAVANYQETIAVYRQTVLTAFQDVEDGIVASRVLADEAQQLDAAVASATRSLEIANARYAGGVTTYLEVITAQTAVLGNQLAAVDVATRRMTASVRLIEALGGGWTTADLPTRH